MARREVTEASEIEADRAVVAAVLSGDRQAREAFVERFARLVFAVVGRTAAHQRRRLDDDWIDEGFGEVFVALFDRDARRLRQWTGKCSLATWVRLVTTSVTLDRLRRGAREAVSDQEGEVEPLSVGPGVEEVLVRAAELAAVTKALATLAPSDRQLLEALYVEEHTPGEVAARLGIAAGALYTRKNRALERLREAFRKDE